MQITMELVSCKKVCTNVSEMCCREQHIPAARNPARPGEQQQTDVFQTNCPLFYCDYLFTFYTCCGCPPIMPDCPFLSVSVPLPLMESCFFRSLNRGLSPSFTSPKRQARSSLHLCITDSFHQCWVPFSSWCQISAQPTKPTPCFGSCITSWKALLCSRLCKGCLQRCSSFIHSVLYALFLLQLFPLMWQKAAVCVGGSVFLELNPCLCWKQLFQLLQWHWNPPELIKLL